jgi:hypothetical protein
MTTRPPKSTGVFKSLAAVGSLILLPIVAWGFLLFLSTDKLVSGVGHVELAVAAISFFGILVLTSNWLLARLLKRDWMRLRFAIPCVIVVCVVQVLTMSYLFFLRALSSIPGGGPE